MHFRIPALLTVCASLAFASTAPASLITWVNVNNLGNAHDSTGYGRVNYHYQISAHETSINQYAEFLNAKAASDPYELYSTEMGIHASAGIVRSGQPGSYTYTVKDGAGNRPIAFVNWYDSIRFANWMNNGKGNGDTETGSYTLLGNTPIPSNGATIRRNAGGKVFLPMDNEWYKAAYHQPAAAGGDPSNYWDYPTRTNIAPSSAAPPGDDSNVANIFVLESDGEETRNGGYALTQKFDLLDLDVVNYLNDGGAYTTSGTHYGVFDMGGNVWEWGCQAFSPTQRLVRGGGWYNGPESLISTYRSGEVPDAESDYYGFRLVMIPEPMSGAMLLGASAIILNSRRPRRHASR
jgi:formylglycine-generating enzyme